jgi:glycosyltransferase involved in cell wall biosynthesis
LIRAAVIFVNYGPYHMARARGLARIAGIDACFVELGTEEARHPWLIDRSRVNVDLHTLVRGSYDQVSLLYLYRRLARLLGALRPDAVVVSSYHPPIMLAAAAWAKRHDAVSILMYETTESDHPRARWKETVKRLLVKRYFDAAFVGGSASLDYLVKLGMSPSRIWRGCDVVENDVFSGARERQLAAGGPQIRTGGSGAFLYVGRFSAEKNLLRLVRAYSLYRRSRSLPWDLVLVGDGPERQQIVHTLTSLGLDDVCCPGFMQVDDLVSYYAMGSALILPSTSEPWGLVVNEAMASGLPVLVSNRCGCARDLVFDGVNGFVFDPYDVDDIAATMSILSDTTSDERRSMSDTSRRIIAKYTPETWGESLAECIVETIRTARDGDGATGVEKQVSSVLAGTQRNAI